MQNRETINFLGSYLTEALTEQDTPIFDDLLTLALRLPKTRQFIFETQAIFPHIQAQGRLIDYIIRNPHLVDAKLLELIQDQQRFRDLPGFQIQAQLLQVIYLLEVYQTQRKDRMEQKTFGFISMFSPTREAFFVEVAKLKCSILAVNLNFEQNARAKLGLIFAELASLIAKKEQEWLGRTNTGVFTNEESINTDFKIGSYKQEIAPVFERVELIFENIQTLFANFEAMDSYVNNLIYDTAPLSDILGYQPVFDSETVVTPSAPAVALNHPWEQSPSLYPHLDGAIELELVEEEEAPPSYAIATQRNSTEKDLITFSEEETASSAPSAPESEVALSIPAQSSAVSTNTFLNMFPSVPTHPVANKETKNAATKLAASSFS